MNVRPLLAGVLVASTTACGSSLVVKRPPTTGIRTVRITLDASGCNPAALALKSGPSSFIVSNPSSAKVTEFEIHKGTDILAEAEFVTPGLSKVFAITLQPGHYTTLCTGGSRNAGKGTLTVTGTVAKSTGGPSPEAAARAIANYRTYLEEQSNDLVTRTRAFVQAVKTENVAQARRLYASTRAPLERIEPVVKSFSDLYPRLNARASDVTTGHWQGFHRIERALFTEQDVTAMQPTATDLLADVESLQSRIRNVHLEPASIANGAIDLLNSVTSRKLTGQEDLDAHTDVSDAVAGVEGARAAFEAVSTLLPKKSPIDVAETEQRFAALADGLAALRNGTGYEPVDSISPAAARKLFQLADSVIEQVSRLPRELV